jgi:hypothetical protein
MPQIDENTAYGELTVQGLTFSVPRPYLAGHVLNEAEASQLNQVFGENIRNNFAAKMRGKVEEYRKANSIPDDQEIGADVLDKDTLDAEFAEFANAYEFGVRQSSGSPRTPADPVAKEAQRIARERVKGALVKKGVKLSTVSEEQWKAWIAQVLEKYPDIREEAQRRVTAAAEIAVEGLEL